MIKYISSLFWGIVGNDENENQGIEDGYKGQELEEIQPSAELGLSINDEQKGSPVSARNIQINRNDLQRQRETTFTESDDYDYRTRSHIEEMIAEITSGQTGYSSDNDYSSFEDIPLDFERACRAYMNEGFVNDSCGDSSQNRRVLTAEEIQIEHEKSDNHPAEHDGLGLRTKSDPLHSGQTQSTRSNDGVKVKDSNRKQLGLSKVHAPAKRQAILSDDVYTTEQNILMFENENQEVDVENIPENLEIDIIENQSCKPDSELQRTDSAQVRWKKLAENKDIFTTSTSSILKTNAVVAARLTQAYERAKERHVAKKPSFFKVVQKVHVQRLTSRLKYFIDHNTETSFQFKKPKYYMQDSGSDDDLFASYDPYGVEMRRKKWYEKKPKNSSQRIMQSKFFGKIILMPVIYYRI